MQGVSLGLHGWSRWGQVHEARGRKHHDDTAQSTDVTNSGSVTSANKLVGISTSITTLRSQLNSLTSADAASDSPAVSSASGFDAQIVSKQRGELQIHTREGDVITLKFSNKVSAEVSSQQSSQDGATLQSTSVDVHSRSKISVEIDGDLNADELAAVNDLVGKVGDLANQFYGGDVQATLAQSASLAYDTTQLTGYSLDLGLKQSIRAYAQQVQLAPPTPAPIPASTLPVGVVPVEVPAVDAAPDAAPAEATPLEAAPTDVDSSPAVSEAPVGTVASSDAEPASAAAVTTTAEASPASTDENSVTPAASSPPATTTQTLSEFVARVRSIFSIQHGDASLGFSYDFKVRLLIASIASSAPATTAADSSVPASSAA